MPCSRIWLVSVWIGSSSRTQVSEWRRRRRNPLRFVRCAGCDLGECTVSVRCSAGVTGTGQLLAEITAMGYRGGERTLRRYLISIRGTEQAAPPQPKVPSARQLASWIMRPDANLTIDERDALADARTRCTNLAAIRELAGDFTHLVRHRHGSDLYGWLERADRADAHELRRFATGLRTDLAAVTAGLTLRWSSGAAEGNVNRIKVIKRRQAQNTARERAGARWKEADTPPVWEFIASRGYRIVGSMSGVGRVRWHGSSRFVPDTGCGSVSRA
jgi:Transposase